VRLGHRFFERSSGLLRGAHTRRIDKEVEGNVAVLGLEALPEPAPETARFPAAEAVVDGVPGPKLRGHIAPGNARSRTLEDRFEEQAITEFGGTAGLRCDRGEARFNFGPGFIGEE
jgi:hypothetical protein